MNGEIIKLNNLLKTNQKQIDSILNENTETIKSFNKVSNINKKIGEINKLIHSTQKEIFEKIDFIDKQIYLSQLTNEKSNDKMIKNSENNFN